MKSNPRNILFILLILGSISCMQSGILESERTISFDTGWRFIKDDPKGAENASYDDSGWRSIDLPHDWSIEDLTDQSDSVIGPFSRASIGKMRTGYTIGGTGWYRKTFTIDRADGENTAYLNFDGVFMNSEMWINGKYVGRHSYGYTSFYFDITPYLNPAGQNNLVAVRIRNEGETARWYSGSGIYRHTWLTLVKPSDMSSFQQPKKKAWRGKCLAIVRPLGKQPGTVSLQATAEGLTPAAIEINLQ